MGVAVSINQLSGPRTASERWLASRNLVLQRVAPTDEPIPTRSTLRARSSGRGRVVAGILVSHSQRLCRSPGPAEFRPWVVRPPEAGFRLQQLERSELGVRIGVSRAEGPAGELVGVATEDGPVWLQVGAGRAPALADIVSAIARDYSVALGPRARASVPVGP